jgi:hypothetical protein
VRSGDKRAAGGDIHCAEIVGFEAAAGDFAELGTEAPQHFQVALGFEQCLCGKDDFLAGVGEVARQRQPVGDANLLAPRADHFTDVNDIDRRVVSHFGVELEDFVFWPEVEQRPKREFHGVPGLNVKVARATHETPFSPCGRKARKEGGRS